MQIGQWLFRVPTPPPLLNPHPAPSCTRHAAHRPRPSRQSRRGQPPHTGVAGRTDITLEWPRDPAKGLPPGLAIALPRAGNRIARGRQLNCPRPAIEVPAAGTRCTRGWHSMYQRPALDVPRAGTRCTSAWRIFRHTENKIPSPWEFLLMAEHWLKRRGGGAARGWANGRRGRVMKGGLEALLEAICHFSWQIIGHLSKNRYLCGQQTPQQTTMNILRTLRLRSLILCPQQHGSEPCTRA